MEMPTEYAPGSYAHQITSSPAYQRMVALLKLAWMATEVHDGDHGLRQFSQTPKVVGFNGSETSRREAFKTLMAQATGSSVEEITRDKMWDTASADTRDIIVKGMEGNEELCLRLHKPVGFSKEDIQVMYALASEYKYTDKNYTDFNEPQDAAIYLDTHRLFLHTLSQAGLDFMEEIFPVKQKHVLSVANNMKMAARQIAETQPDAKDAFRLSHEMIE